VTVERLHEEYDHLEAGAAAYAAQLAGIRERALAAYRAALEPLRERVRA
jgi:hypothetical protein